MTYKHTYTHTTHNSPHTHLMVVRVSHVNHLVTVIPCHAQWVLETSFSPFSIHITKRKQVLQFRDTCRHSSQTHADTEERRHQQHPNHLFYCEKSCTQATWHGDEARCDGQKSCTQVTWHGDEARCDGQKSCTQVTWHGDEARCDG